VAVDYSKLTDEELEAIANNDYSKLSDSTLNALAASTPAPKETKSATLDYSTLSDSELEAIANNDYSKLSDATLNALVASDQPKANPSINMAPQMATVAKELAPGVLSGAGTLAKAAVAGPMDVANIAKILYQNASLDTVGQFIKEPIANTAKAAEAYVAGHPLLGKVTGATPQQAVGALGRGIAATGGAVARGLVGPESAVLMPYQMAAYEQEKIRANPTAPEYATNPYAQAYRGEFPTQGAAGAANRRQAVATAPTGYTPTPQEAGNLLNSGDERTINTFGGRKRLQEIIAGSVQAQAASRILPVKPGGF